MGGYSGDIAQRGDRGDYDPDRGGRVDRGDASAPLKPWTEEKCIDPTALIPATCIKPDAPIGRGLTAQDAYTLPETWRVTTPNCAIWWQYIDACLNENYGLLYGGDGGPNATDDTTGPNGQNGNGNGDTQAAGFGNIWTIVGILGISAGVLATVLRE